MPGVDTLPKRARELFDELYDSANLTNKKKLDELLRTVVAGMVPASFGGTMKVESMVASKSKNPIVIFSWGTNKGELSPVQARQYALQILEASEGAVQDASLYRAVIDSKGKTDTLEVADKMAFALIGMVRENRGRFEGGSDA